MDQSDEIFSPLWEIELFPFCVSSAGGLEEKNYQRASAARPTLLHQILYAQWHEHARKEEIWKAFRADPYNIHSSLCSVLSIPYKLASLGIKSRGEKAAREYWNMILNPENPDSIRKIGRLIYLEHHRWMSFMMTEGYNNSGPRFRDYAFAGDNDQRNKAEKLHICIYDCGEEGIVLDSFSHEMWDDPNLKNCRPKGIILDPWMSCRLLFINSAPKESGQWWNGKFESAFRKLERALRDEKILK